MPWMSVDLTPGVNSELTPTALGSGYSDTWLGRFKAGRFQKLGGWTKLLNYPASGTPKAIHSWTTNSSNAFLSVATTSSLIAITGNGVSNGALTSPSYQDITPQRFESNVAPKFTTTAGSSTVSVYDGNISTVTPYCAVYIATPVYVDGLTLFGMYPVTGSLSAQIYTIQANATATSGVANGGVVPQFTTSSGSSSVTVTLPYHKQAVGYSASFNVPSTVGGLTISGTYSVQSVLDGNNFTITANSQASSSVANSYMNSNNASFAYYIASGPTPIVAAYGTGNYGAGAYGIGVVLPGMSANSITSTDWTLTNWGEDLVACQENGPIFYWPPNGGVQNALVMPGAPPFNGGAFVSTSQQMVIAYGSSETSGLASRQNPLLVRWCNVQDFTDWTASTTNQAGSFPIPTGSKIVAGAATPFCNLIWTDIELWTMHYIGSDFVFNFTRTGSNCGIIGKHAYTQLAGNVFWLGKNNIFTLSGGGVSIVPCSVWDVIFQDLNTDYANACWCGSNTLFSEVIIAYPSKADGQSYPTRYVKLNITEGTWDVGKLQRSCWVDQTNFGPPIACTVNGTLYTHETGSDDDLSPMTSGFTTGYFYVDEGRQAVFVDQIMPDFKFGKYGNGQGAIISVTVNAINYPGDTPTTYGPFVVNSTTETIPCRIRARQFSLTVQSSDSGSFWRLGKLRFRYAPDGRI